MSWMRSTNYQPIARCNESHEVQLRVGDIWNPTTNPWNFSLLMEIFDDFTIEQIRDLDIGNKLRTFIGLELQILTRLFGQGHVEGSLE